MSPADGGAVATVALFNAAFDRRDLDAVMALMSQDCVFDGTSPPDGERFTGQDAVAGAFRAVFDGARSGTFTTEEIFAAGVRVVARWRYDGVDHAGGAGHVRGVDLFTVADGRVVEKLSYVKG